jgi:hypothetical protein
MTIDPKYVAVNGSRGPEIKCVAYWYGPMRKAQEEMKSNEPTDHLKTEVSLIQQELDRKTCISR